MLYTQLRLLFHKVSVAKPSSSRNSSIEAFVVCQKFKGGEFFNLPLEGSFDPDSYVIYDDDGTISGEWKAGAGGLCELNDKRSEILPSIVPFVACGDLSGYDSSGIPFLDADKSYPIESIEVNSTQSGEKGQGKQSNKYIKPIAPPIKPPYENSIAIAKQEKQRKKK